MTNISEEVEELKQHRHMTLGGGLNSHKSIADMPGTALLDNVQESILSHKRAIYELQQQFERLHNQMKQ